MNKENQVISVSHNIDKIIGGGIQEGNIALLGGTYRSGKTTTALHFAANAQKSCYGKKEVYYFDVGRRLTKDRLQNRGLDLSRFNIIQSVEDKILSFNDILSTTERVIKDTVGSVIIMDSFSSLLEIDIFNDDRKNQLGLLAEFTKRIATDITNNKHILVGTLTKRDNTTGVGKPYFTRTSNSLEFQSHTKLFIEKYEPWKNQLGQTVNWKCEWSALTSPGKTCKSYISYDRGIDEEMEMLNGC